MTISRCEIYRLEEVLKELAMFLLSDFNVVDDGIGVTSWSKFNANFLRFCIDEKIITRHDAKRLIIDRLRQIARKCYKEHLKERTEPDHTTSPEAFAYGLKNCVFSMEEVDKIQFDGTVEKFVKRCPNNFPDVILKKLLEYE